MPTSLPVARLYKIWQASSTLVELRATVSKLVPNAVIQYGALYISGLNFGGIDFFDYLPALPKVPHGNTFADLGTPAASSRPGCRIKAELLRSFHYRFTLKPSYLLDFQGIKK